MSSNNTIKYSDTEVFKILNKMFEIDEIENTKIEWKSFTNEAIDNIIEKIYQFKDDSQRIGYLNFLLNKFFDDGKGEAIATIAKPLVDVFFKKVDKLNESKQPQYLYIKDCYLLLCEIILKISEHCLVYPKIDFPELIERNFRVHNVSPFYLFVVYTKNKIINSAGELEESKKGKAGAPKKVVDKGINLKSIMYPGYYKAALNYYKLKMLNKNFKKQQYGQLIREFINKGWVLPDYKNLSPHQTSALIYQEFKIKVSPETARKNPTGNDFLDMENKLLQMP